MLLQGQVLFPVKVVLSDEANRKSLHGKLCENSSTVPFLRMNDLTLTTHYLRKVFSHGNWKQTFRYHGSTLAARLRGYKIFSMPSSA